MRKFTLQSHETKLLTAIIISNIIYLLKRLCKSSDVLLIKWRTCESFHDYFQLIILFSLEYIEVSWLLRNLVKRTDTTCQASIDLLFFTAKTSSPLKRRNYKRQLAVSWPTYLHCTCFSIDKWVVLLRLNTQRSHCSCKVRQHIALACCRPKRLAHSVEIRNGSNLKTWRSKEQLAWLAASIRIHYSRTARIYGFVHTETSLD